MNHAEKWKADFQFRRKQSLILAAKRRCEFTWLCGSWAAVGGSRQRLVSGNMLGRAQSLRLTPKVSSFFAYESLRFVAFAAASAAAWTALGPFCAAALINPNL